MNHDPLCYVAKNGGNCCPWLPACDCQCTCDWIKEIRLDTLNAAWEAVAADAGKCDLHECDAKRSNLAAIDRLRE